MAEDLAVGIRKNNISRIGKPRMDGTFIISILRNIGERFVRSLFFLRRLCERTRQFIVRKRGHVATISTPIIHVRVQASPRKPSGLLIWYGRLIRKHLFLVERWFLTSHDKGTCDTTRPRKREIIQRLLVHQVRPHHNACITRRCRYKP